MGVQVLILALQVTGFLAAGALVALIWPGGAGTFAARLTAATAVVAAIWFVVQIPTDTRAEVKAVDATRATLSAPTAASQRRYCLNEPGGISSEFVDFLQHQMRPGDHYALFVSPDLASKSLPLCLDYILLPRVQVDAAKDADWAVFIDSTPPQWRAQLAQKSPDVYRVAPGLTLIRLHRAS